jgi:conjugative transfer signal peptidase TraF
MFALRFGGFLVNTTASLPLGLYRETRESIGRGMFAVFCLEDREFIRLAKERGYLGEGSCPGGIKPLGKEVFGLPGDEISLQDGLIVVNGETVPLSGAKSVDSQGRAMPAQAKLKNGTIPKGYVLMLSPHHAGGFDSRYFGLIRLSSLHPVKPVFIW